MNQLGFPILTILIALPVFAGVACLFADAKAARWIALGATLVDFLLGILLWATYQTGGAQWQFTENLPLFGQFSWALGIDGIALMLVELSVFLMPLCVLASWKAIEKRVPEYMAALLLTEALMLGVFEAQDLFLFYLFFEAGLIPMYLIIGIWGGAERIYASYKFFLYTLLGSVLMLIAMLWMVGFAHTTSIPVLMQTNFPAHAQTWLFLAFFASFAVKMPMWPVHTWLPDAHVQAPTAGSVILAGVLLKMGGYGFIRFSLPMFPIASAQLFWLIATLSGVAIVYTSLVALVQNDMKKLIAYSSVAHMAFVTFGLFAFNRQGLEGSLLVMLSHGLVSGALFLCVGVVYDRLHTRDIAAYGGLVSNMPRYAVAFMVFTMANVGLPGTSGFIGEFLTMIGTFQVNTWVVFFAAFGVIFSAAYALYLYRRIIFGALTKPSLKGMLDLNFREVAVLVPLIVLTIFFGFYPAPILDATAASVNLVAENFSKAISTGAALVASVN